jgi:CRP/FNR family transcriptional regulator, cyclic AMP receptor protein
MKKILLIEDNDDIRENTAEILELANYQVFTAMNGKEGVELALAENPDLIICDIMMPVLDGYGVLHAIHKNESIKNTPFIFLTAKTERTDFRKGMELGADDYITKPFDGTELLNAVDSRLKKVELLKKELSTGLEGLNELLYSSGHKDALNALTADREINKFKKKQVIYSEGNHPVRLYYVKSGKVKTFKTNEDGKELVVELYHAGDFLGHIAMLEGTTYKETAEAMDDCEIAAIPKEEFEELLNNNKEVAQRFIKLLAKNIADKEHQLLGMAYNSLRKKVADALMMLKKKYAANDSQKFIIDISRDNLATIAGTATESLIRTLSDFRSEKLIDIKEGHITILNEKKLETLLN